MKAFFGLSLPLFICASTLALADVKAPLVGGPFTELRKAPLFEAEKLPLAKTWGPALPIGTAFEVQKVYGRWLYGVPVPPKHMKPADYAKPGWIFSRMMLVPGDKDTQSPELLKTSYSLLFHSREAWKKLKLDQDANIRGLDFMEGLTLSRGTEKAFIQHDEASAGSGFNPFPSLIPPGLSRYLALPSAEAAESDETKDPPMGLSGTDLSFLDQEFSVVKQAHSKAERERMALQLHAPKAPVLDTAVRTGILGRFMLNKYFELPPLTHEEVDGFIYMRATALRALEGCPKPVQNFWQHRRWNAFRVYRLKSRPEVRHPWLDISLPGGYFTYSARALDLATNEAELAFLLVRPMVLEARLKRPAIALKTKGWPESLQAESELVWDKTLRAQSTRDADNLDVADDIAVDMTTLECISRAGYRPLGGVNYLRKIAAAREEPWSKWFNDHSIGLDYRLEQVTTRLDDALAKQKFPAGTATNPKRFSLATTRWNLMP
ncbi:MAG: hypothetical protein ACXWQO_19360 [Bdellovibrionota bacterium]